MWMEVVGFPANIAVANDDKLMEVATPNKSRHKNIFLWRERLIE